MDYVEKWGVDVDEAVNLALLDLKLTKDEVEVIVLEEPSKGFFGIGSKLAKVRVEKKNIKPQKQFKAETTVKKEETKKVDTSTNNSKIKNKYDFTKKKELLKKEQLQKKEEKQQEYKVKKKNLEIEPLLPEGLVDIESHEALDFLRDLIDKMSLTATVKAKQGDRFLYFEIEGKDSGTIIGKRGQTLDSIQYLTSLLVNKDVEKYIKVVVDVENYRQKRRKTLEELANRLGDKVVKTKKYTRLEPMNPYERKVIHATLQSNDAVVTRSEGSEPHRRVIIELKK